MSVSSIPKDDIIEINENKLSIVAAIIPFSIAGALIRIALQRLEDYPGAPVFALVYAQCIGCFIMGLAIKYKPNLFSWYHPLHAGISSGLCGSITTFSSWQLNIFKEFANYNANPHTTGKNVLAAISQFLVTFAMSFTALVFGQHVGNALLSCQSRLLPNLRVTENSTQIVIPRGFSTRHLHRRDWLLILFALASWLSVIFAAIFSYDQKELALACVFAPVGALTRWYLSFYNGRCFASFPIGTFIANIFGTIVLAALSIVESGATSLTPIACDVLNALGDGFCGCLTTVSTFMVELTTLPRRSSYMYGSISVILAQCFMFVMLGSYIWSRGVNPSCT